MLRLFVNLLFEKFLDYIFFYLESLNGDKVLSVSENVSGQQA